jgi:spermidine/putrescine transport system permease protein
MITVRRDKAAQKNHVHSERDDRLRSTLTSGPGLMWMLCFLFIPLLAVVAISFMTRGEYGEIGLPLTLDNYRRLLGFGILGFDPLYPAILIRSLALGLATASICMVAALPLCFFIGRLPLGWRTAGLILIVIPFWTNLLIRTYAWQILLSPGGWICRLAEIFGWISPGTGLYPGVFAILVGMVCDFLPFMVLPLYASVEKIDWCLAEAAVDLGANGSQVFRHAILPQILPGLGAGCILVFLPATGQFVIPDLLGGAKTTMLGNLIQQQFGAGRDWPFGAAISFVALLLVMAGLWFRGAKQAGGEGGLL